MLMGCLVVGRRVVIWRCIVVCLLFRSEVEEVEERYVMAIPVCILGISSSRPPREK